MTCPFGSLGVGTIPRTATCSPRSRTLVEPTSLGRLLGNPLAARPLLIVVGRGRGRIRGPIRSRYCSTTAARASRSQLAFRVVRIFRLLGRVATALPRRPSTQAGGQPPGNAGCRSRPAPLGLQALTRLGWVMARVPWEYTWLAFCVDSTQWIMVIRWGPSESTVQPLENI